jgi:membrane protein YdbS with pleckstrin-like domain
METGVERAIEDTHPKRHDPGSPNAASSSLETLPFRLQHGEKIIRELKPQFFGFMMTKALGGYMGVIGFAVVSIVVVILFSSYLSGFLVEIALLPFFIVFLAIIVSLKPLIQYGKSWYWITNHRVIGKRGFFGYTINSVPLENVADVVLTRTLLDRLLGLSSLIIVSMGNAPLIGSSEEDRAESPNFFPALTEDTAREMQRVLFNLRDDMKGFKDVVAAPAPVEAPKAVAVPEAPAKSRKGSTQESIQPRRTSSK